MQKLWNSGKYISILVIVIVLVVAATSLMGPRIGNTFSTIINCLDCPSVAVPTPIILPTNPFLEPVTGGGGVDPLEQVDILLKNSIPASIAYNAPAEMQLGETVTLELLLNPSISETELIQEIKESGVTSSASVEITPQMKAEIFAVDEGAFSIRRIHDDPMQLVSGIETTRWAWFVTAKKEGRQQLTIVLYRLIKYEDTETWREVESYKSDIDIKVTLLGRLQYLGWGWIAAAVLVVSGIVVSWRRLGPGKGRREDGSAPAAPGEDLGHIFLSYRRSDSADITGRIYDRLAEDIGENLLFKDVDSIPLGVDFKDYLDRKVGECRVLLAIIGDRWADARDADGNRRLDDPDDFVRIEIESALERGIPVIPLLVRGAQVPAREDLPESLRDLVYRNGIPVRPDPDFHRDLDRLVSALKKHL